MSPYWRQFYGSLVRAVAKRATTRWMRWHRRPLFVSEFVQACHASQKGRNSAIYIHSSKWNLHFIPSICNENLSSSWEGSVPFKPNQTKRYKCTQLTSCHSRNPSPDEARTFPFPTSSLPHHATVTLNRDPLLHFPLTRTNLSLRRRARHRRPAPNLASRRRKHGPVHRSPRRQQPPDRTGAPSMGSGRLVCSLPPPDGRGARRHCNRMRGY